MLKQFFSTDYTKFRVPNVGFGSRSKYFLLTYFLIGGIAYTPMAVPHKWNFLKNSIYLFMRFTICNFFIKNINTNVKTC